MALYTNFYALLYMNVIAIWFVQRWDWNKQLIESMYANSKITLYGLKAMCQTQHLYRWLLFF